MRVRGERGYVLLEALVALLIFSLGLLGMLGFQAAATRIATDSRFRTEAAILADELISKMSVDKRAVVVSEYVFDSTGGGGASAGAWFKRVKEISKLPNAKAKVDVENGKAVDTFVVTVTIEWELPGAKPGANGNESLEHGRYVTQAMLF